MHILIADVDDEDLRDYRELLGDYRLKVFTAHHGLECVAKVRLFRPDVLVLDSRLLWGGAEGVVECVRAEPSLRSMRIVLLADDRQTIPWRRATSPDVDIVGLKPVTPEQLYQLIRPFEQLCYEKRRSAFQLHEFQALV